MGARATRAARRRSEGETLRTYFLASLAVDAGGNPVFLVVASPAMTRSRFLPAAAGFAVSLVSTPPMAAPKSGAPAGSSDIYLSPAETGGKPFLFNPDSQALREIAKRKPPRPDDLLDARDLASDLAFLRAALRKEYAGYPELLQIPDFDVEAFFDQKIASLRRGPRKVTFREGALDVLFTLRGKLTDRHLTVRGGYEPRDVLFAEYQATFEAGAPDPKTCAVLDAPAATLRVAPVVLDERRRATLLTLSAHRRAPGLELSCAGKSVSLTERRHRPFEEGERGRPAYEWRRIEDAAVIRIRRFYGGREDEARLRQLAKDYGEHRKAATIVFDLRGNEGGNDGYMSRWVDEAKSGPWDFQIAQVYPIGAHMPWFSWNDNVWSGLTQGTIDDPEAVEERRTLRQGWPKRASTLSPQFLRSATTSSAKAPYHGKVVVLVDGACGSSGESGAWLLKQALGALFVGERSAGYLEYGNQRELVLPRTGLVWAFATKRNYYEGPVEGVGLPPDVYLPAELMSAPAESLLPLLRTLGSERPARP